MLYLLDRFLFPLLLLAFLIFVILLIYGVIKRHKKHLILGLVGAIIIVVTIYEFFRMTSLCCSDIVLDCTKNTEHFACQETFTISQ